MIQYVLDTCGLSDKKEKILMIGDREHDVLGAREQGLECVASCLAMVTGRKWKTATLLI